MATKFLCNAALFVKLATVVNICSPIKKVASHYSHYQGDLLMKFLTRLFIITVVIFLGGCASPPQQSLVPLNQDILGSKASRIGVAMTKLPKVDTDLPGASCLLCMAVASAANSALTAHANSLPTEDLAKLKSEIAALLRSKGADVMVIEEEINVSVLPDSKIKGENFAKKDFSSMKQKYLIDKLLVIDITALGFIRTYSSYVPTSDPKGMLRGAGYIVDLNKNAYDWYLPINITKSTDDNWDEPPKFPGLTNAFFQTVEIAKDGFLNSLAK